MTLTLEQRMNLGKNLADFGNNINGYSVIRAVLIISDMIQESEKMTFGLFDSLCKVLEEYGLCTADEATMLMSDKITEWGLEMTAPELDESFMMAMKAAFGI